MSLPVALTPGTVIDGHYIIGDLINKGGFGAVYRGVDTSEGNRPCAIKETYDVTPAARRQALIEAGVLFTIRSPHLPEVYDALEANRRFYLVMQLIEGQNLLQLLRSRVPGGLVGEQVPHSQSHGPCSEQEVLSWLLPIMDVLQELHSRRPPVMHRDIKPGNIILTPQQRTVLVDFGLTKLYDPDSITQTLVKPVSEGFSPIEQYLGKTSPQSDIYSIAATMYLLLTNRLPPASIVRGVHDGLIAPRQLNPALSVKTERALLKALAVNADQRFQHMQEFTEALRSPTFTSHSDPTIASSPFHTNPTVAVSPIAASSAVPQTVPPPSSASVPRPSLQPAHSISPSPPPRVYQQVPQASHPQPILGPKGGYSPSPPAAYPYQPPVAPPSQPVWQPPQALPTVFGQGCLWGLVGGTLAALLVLMAQKDTGFYLALLVAAVFYVIAGYATTRKGGTPLRGGWAACWTSIDGFITFWVAFFIGLAVNIVQRLQAITNAFPRISPNFAFSQAWNGATRTYFHNSYSPTSRQSGLISVLVMIALWLGVAFALGWGGGLLGNMRYKEKMARRAKKAQKVQMKSSRANP